MAQDQRRAVERAEHDRRAAISGQMRVGFVPRAADIEIADPLVIEHPERIHALWAKIDPRVGSGGGNEKHRLFGDKCAMVVGQMLSEIRHGKCSLRGSGCLI